MTLKQLKLLCFYCWQLGITTLDDLTKRKAQYNVTTNDELLQAMAKAYNGNEWATLHGLE